MHYNDKRDWFVDMFLESSTFADGLLNLHGMTEHRDRWMVHVVMNEKTAPLFEDGPDGPPALASDISRRLGLAADVSAAETRAHTKMIQVDYRGQRTWRAQITLRTRPEAIELIAFMEGLLRAKAC